jgi:hypothetical protein
MLRLKTTAVILPPGKDVRSLDVEKDRYKVSAVSKAINEKVIVVPSQL